MNPEFPVNREISVNPGFSVNPESMNPRFSMHSVNPEEDHQTNYLKAAAIRCCTSFRVAATSPNFTDPVLELGYIEMLMDYEIALQSQTDPLHVIDTILKIVDWCRNSLNFDLLYHPDLGHRKEVLMIHTSMIYDVFCLGFCNMACTMNNQLSIIDDNMTISDQIIKIKQSPRTIRQDTVAQYPELLAWVKLCGVNWVTGLNRMLDTIHKMQNKYISQNAGPICILPESHQTILDVAVLMTQQDYGERR